MTNTINIIEHLENLGYGALEFSDVFQPIYDELNEKYNLYKIAYWFDWQKDSLWIDSDYTDFDRLEDIAQSKGYNSYVDFWQAVEADAFDMLKKAPKKQSRPIQRYISIDGKETIEAIQYVYDEELGGERERLVFMFDYSSPMMWDMHKDLYFVTMYVGNNTWIDVKLNDYLVRLADSTYKTMTSEDLNKNYILIIQ